MSDSEQKKVAVSSFQIRPDLDKKFSRMNKTLQGIIHSCLVENLSDFAYSSEAAEKKVEDVSQIVQKKVMELEIPHYKYIVHVSLGEQRGEGIKIAARCLWDSDADGHVFDNFITETFFCNVTVYGLYHC